MFGNEVSGQVVASVMPIFAFNTMYRQSLASNATLGLNATTNNNIGAAVVQNIFENFLKQFQSAHVYLSLFRRLFQRELLDGDESRLRVMATQMFFDQFKGLLDLAAKLAPERDAHMTAVSIIALVLFHLETTPLRQFMPGGLARHNDPEVIAAHVTELLLKGIVK